ncbi:MAG: antitoxin AF2212-like protein [Halobacteriota archaeon]
MNMTTRTKAIYEEGVLKPLEKIALEEKEEIWIEIKKRRMKGILKVDPKIVDEVIENEELFE